MRPFPRSYTNRTVGDGSVVVKSYVGPGAEARYARECAALRGLADLLPVPPVVASHDRRLTMGLMGGTHGQDLLEAGHPRDVLHAAGTILRRIHGLDVGELVGDLVWRTGSGATLVHGDFGPNNMLIDPVTWKVRAVVDWEWVDLADPIEDVAWCEWIVRRHHPQHVTALKHFFDAYGGEIPSWPLRWAAMLAKCRMHLELCRDEDPGGSAVAAWEQHLEKTAGWTE